ncbi:hypothetical protein Bbelb_438400 [Branchiostoma belcheri]|nr:hypothetical protein Bbelb_438400 [Branchiostoma belcheri]
MESDLLEKLQEFPSPFFWDLNESMYENVHEKLSQWNCSDTDRLAWSNATAFLSYARDKDTLQARRQFQEVLEEDPDNLVALTSLAYIDVKHSDVEQAETRRKLLVELKESGGESRVQSRWAAAMFEKAFCLTRFGQWRYREAQTCIEEARMFDSENIEWLKTETFLLTKQVESQALVRVPYGEIKNFLGRAADNVLQLQKMEPGSGEVLCMTAELFKAAGSTGQGQSWMKAYKRKNPDQSLDPSVLYQQAYALCPTDQHVCRQAVLHLKAAEEYLREGVRLDPLFTRCGIALAQCLYYQGKVQESWEQFRIAAEESRDKRNKVEARREWARLLIDHGNESGALMQLREALKFEGQAGVSVYRGLDNALNSWYKIDQGNPRLIRLRAAFALAAGNDDRAIECYKQALKIDKDDTPSLIGLGKAYRKKGKDHFEEAKKWFEKASGLGDDKADDELFELEMEILQMEEQSGVTSPPRENLDHGTAESPHTSTYEDE